MPQAKLISKITKGTDFELHLRTVREEGITSIELRDYVPSQKWYGRGINFEPAHLPQIIEKLTELGVYLGGDANPTERISALAASHLDPNQGTL